MAQPTKNSLSSFFLGFFGFKLTEVFGEKVIWRATNNPVSYAQLKLKAWTNQARQRLYHQDVHYLLNATPREYEREMDPEFEYWPKGVIFMDIKQDGYLRVAFDPASIDLDQIVEYLRRIGVLMELVGDVITIPSKG
ncbi:hypothetical protein M0Q28_00405 [Patescibacteria group bacterium]|nr:hypothetical protein [Patescibacteria group bacterium]